MIMSSARPNASPKSVKYCISVLVNFNVVIIFPALPRWVSQESIYPEKYVCHRISRYDPRYLMTEDLSPAACGRASDELSNGIFPRRVQYGSRLAVALHARSLSKGSFLPVLGLAGMSSRSEWDAFLNS
jgi:hypothetical protein